jgi:hypothetical protein
MVASLLAPEGIFMANCVDILSIGRFLNAYLNTIEATFPYSAVYSMTDATPDQRSTFVVAASRRPLEPEALEDQSGGVYAKRLDRRTLEDLEARNGRGPLTDEYAPVENLIAPVFLRSIN